MGFLDFKIQKFRESITLCGISEFLCRFSWISRDSLDFYGFLQVSNCNMTFVLLDFYNILCGFVQWVYGIPWLLTL